MKNRRARRESELPIDHSPNLEVVSEPDAPITIEVYHLPEAEEAAFNIGHALDNYISKWRLHTG